MTDSTQLFIYFHPKKCKSLLFLVLLNHDTECTQGANSQAKCAFGASSSSESFNPVIAQARDQLCCFLSTSYLLQWNPINIGQDPIVVWRLVL